MRLRGGRRGGDTAVATSTSASSAGIHIPLPAAFRTSSHSNSNNNGGTTPTTSNSNAGNGLEPSPSVHHNSTVTSNNNNPSPNTSYIHVPILGSRGCGKSTLAEQLVQATDSSSAFSSPMLFSDSAPFSSSSGNGVTPLSVASAPRHFYPLILVNDKIHHAHIIDCPTVAAFPRSSVQEWSHYRGCYLRHATAYIILFDVTSRESFCYAKLLREQIVSERPQVPIILVANKVDKLCPFTVKGVPMGSATLMHNKQRSELANLIRKQWKGTQLVECSAKYDWHVHAVICELLHAVDVHDSGTHNKSATARSVVQDVLRRNRCAIM